MLCCTNKNIFNLQYNWKSKIYMLINGLEYFVSITTTKLKNSCVVGNNGKLGSSLTI
jgi:hypothetical protein